MKRLFVLLLLAPLLGACATPFGQNLQNIYTAITGASVSPAAVLVAGNSFDAVEKTATNYIVFCTANRPNPACTNFVTIRDKLAPAVRAGRAARSVRRGSRRRWPGSDWVRLPFRARTRQGPRPAA